MIDMQSPVFSLPWAVMFWGIYIWAFFVSEAGVIRHTKETRGEGPERPQDSLAFLQLLTLAAKIAALLLAWFGIGLVHGTLNLPVFLAGLAHAEEVDAKGYKPQSTSRICTIARWRRKFSACTRLNGS